jgi:hypothetical protein
MRLTFFIIITFLLVGKTTVAQLSLGGHPREAPMLKSKNIPVIEMPSVINSDLEKKAAIDEKSMPELKPFRFAHRFEVEISPANYGIWLLTNDGFKVWKLKIVSGGAKSLNLIFDKFNLPPGARLFLYNEKENHYLGAYSSINNKPSGKFAVSPVAGDEIIVQYEIPESLENSSNFVIKSINHDFIGILKYDERRPLNKVAGACNVDINCEFGEKWKNAKDAVCRIIVDGNEICTGTLINNSGNDDKPYVISAAHCYDEWEYAETTVYTFNYESPYCAPLDGDPSHSISGAVMKAQFDSLDFALAELSLVPPPEFRPFYAGWDRSGTLRDSSASIHHPQGDVKKIALDEDPPQFSDFNSNYTKNGFLKILRWEAGVTENGSSGGPLFNPELNLIGTLTGGVATCSNPVRDYFMRFDLAWDYKSDSARQLKYWLDPANSNTSKLNGKRLYSEENLCHTFTNLNDNDEHSKVPVTNTGEFNGYWGGTNTIGISEITERFSVFGSGYISGISLGVGKITDAPGGKESEITVKIYNGGEFPQDLLHSKVIKIKDLTEDAMNFIGFTSDVLTRDTFFVGFELSNIQPLDSFVVYQSLRQPDSDNNFYFRQDGTWQSFANSNIDGYNMTSVIEILACNISEKSVDTPLVNNTWEILVYPNPTNSVFTLAAGVNIKPEDIGVFNLIGQQVKFNFTGIDNKKAKIDLSGNVPGTYIVRFNNGEDYIKKKITYIPW